LISMEEARIQRMSVYCQQSVEGRQQLTRT
jgi:hypothetical protein